jgi:signal transduction histidine kinase
VSRSSLVSLARVHAVVGFVGAAVTLLVLVDPRLAGGLRDHPDLRLVIEVSGLFLATAAAVVLALTDRADLGPPRDAFIAAVLVLALTNAVFSVGPELVGARPAVDRGLAFYPWVASRFVAGTFLLLAGFGRPRLGPARTVFAAFAALIAVDTALVLAGERLDVPVVLSAGGDVEVVAWHVLAPLLLVPAVLFAVGAWAAGRLHRRGATPLYGWFSVAMTMQVFAQVHGMLAPAFLGPVVTTMDLFRTGSWLLLAGGAVAQLRHLYLARSRTAAQQAEDLREQARLLARQQRLAEREQDFRAVVSHELATPIAAIRTFAHVLDSPAADEHQKRAALGGLRAEMGRLAELVARVDELRDLELAELTCVLRPVAVRPLLEELRAFAAGLPGRREIGLSCEDDRILADPVRFGQLLRNVLSNAARYSPEDAPIALAGRVEDDRWYRVEVTDTGAGIPSGERPRLLEPYARGGDAERTPGTGLGLHVARRLAEGHEGTLEILDGAHGRGTTVAVRLRRAR